MEKLELNKTRGFFLIDLILSLSLLSLILLIYPTYLKNCYDVFIQSNKLLTCLYQIDLTLSEMRSEGSNKTVTTSHPLIIKKEYVLECLLHLLIF